MFEDALAVLEAGTAAKKLRDPLGVKEQRVRLLWRQQLNGTDRLVKWVWRLSSRMLASGGCAVCCATVGC